MAAPPGPAETSPPAANRAGLWRQNSELRERVASLEQEVQTLRRAAAARRLSSRSSGLSPAASSLGLLDRSSSGGVQAAEPAPTVTAPAAPTSATSAQLEQQLAEARCEAAVAAAGIAALTSQLGEAQQEAQQLRAQLGAAQDSLAQAGAERACRAGMAEATAERVRALEAQVSALLREAAAAQEQEHEHEQGEAAAAVQAAPSDSSASTNQAAQPPAARCGSPPARSASRTSSSPRGGYASSPREAYSSGALPLQASPPSQHATRIFNVALPEEDEEGGGEELRREVSAAPGHGGASVHAGAGACLHASLTPAATRPPTTLRRWRACRAGWWLPRRSWPPSWCAAGSRRETSGFPGGALLEGASCLHFLRVLLSRRPTHPPPPRRAGCQAAGAEPAEHAGG